MTLPTIEQLEAMLADATKGPWQRGENGNKRVYGPDGCGEHTGLIVPTVYKANGNAALIALAPTLATQRIADAERIAELEMEIERLVDALAAAEQACEDRADRLNDFGPESECCAATARNCAADVSDCGKATP